VRPGGRARGGGGTHRTRWWWYVAEGRCPAARANLLVAGACKHPPANCEGCESWANERARDHRSTAVRSIWIQMGHHISVKRPNRGASLPDNVFTVGFSPC